MPKRQAKRKLLFPAVATTSILATGGIAYWWLSNRQERVIASQIIPENVLFTAYISTNAAKWDRLQSYGTVDTKAAFNSQLASLAKRFFRDNGYDYRTDIQPWIGKEILIGYLPAKTPDNLTQIIAVLPIADSRKAQELLLNKPQGRERTYKGVKINQQGDFSTTLLGNHIIAANSPQGAEIAVDTYLNKSGIGNKLALASALDKVRNEEAFATLYLNLPTLTDWAIANAPKNLPVASLESQTDSGIVASVELEAERIAFRGVYWSRSAPKPPVNLENRATAIPTLLPSDALMLFSGSSVKSLWEDITSGSSSPVAPFNIKDLETNLESMTGLNWQRDLRPWMNEEFALSLIPKAGTENGTVGLVFMAKASDRSAANQALSKLDAFVAQKYQFKVSESRLGDIPATNWSSPSGNFAATRGFLQTDIALINLGDSVASQFIPKPSVTLADSPLFKLATDSNLTAISGQFFLDLERTVHPGNISLPKLIPEQEKYLKAVKAVGLTTSASEEQTHLFQLSIVPKKL